MVFGRISPTVRKAMSHARATDGVFAVHKPADITSAQVLRDLQHHFNRSQFFKSWLENERERLREASAMSNQHRRRRKEKRLDVKLGHGGTLDPIATGVLITGVGKGTKQLNNFLACTKTYEAVVLFGVATDSYDRVGKVVSRAPYQHVTREKVEEALKEFRGNILQRPSIFSALKVQGKKLYEYAREGIEPPVEILKRPVEVSNLEIVEWYDSGSHDFVWPTEEAGGPEKDVARKMLSKDIANTAATTSTTTTTESEKAAAPAEGEKEGETNPKKRKTPPPSDPVETPVNTASKTGENAQEEPNESSPKRQKLDTSEESKQQEQPLSETTPATTQTEDTTTATVTATSSSSQTSPIPPPPAVKLTMTVSSGFYVRSLAHDIGLALGSNAIMSSLVRSRQGDFELSPEKILEYKDLEAGEEVWGPKLQGFLNKWNGEGEEVKEDGSGNNKLSGDEKKTEEKQEDQ